MRRCEGHRGWEALARPCLLAAVLGLTALLAAHCAPQEQAARRAADAVGRLVVALISLLACLSLPACLAGGAGLLGAIDQGAKMPPGRHRRTAVPWGVLAISIILLLAGALGEGLVLKVVLNASVTARDDFGAYRFVDRMLATIGEAVVTGTLIMVGARLFGRKEAK